MTLANMRSLGPTRLSVGCWKCGVARTIDADRFDGEATLQEIGRRLVCSACGGRDVDCRPDWSQHRASGKGERG